MDVNLLGFPSYLERDCIRYGTIALYMQLAVIYTTMLAGLVMDVNLLGFFQVNFNRICMRYGTNELCIQSVVIYTTMHACNGCKLLGRASYSICFVVRH